MPCFASYLIFRPGLRRLSKDLNRIGWRNSLISGGVSAWELGHGNTVRKKKQKNTPDNISRWFTGGEIFRPSHVASKRDLGSNAFRALSACAAKPGGFKQTWPPHKPQISPHNRLPCFLLSLLRKKKQKNMCAVSLAATHNPSQPRDWNRMEFETF